MLTFPHLRSARLLCLLTACWLVVVPVASAQQVIAPGAAVAVALRIGASSLDGPIGAFGIRNVAGLDRALKEAVRVLDPGGRFVILEFSTPRERVLRSFYLFYFRNVLPLIGRLVSGHRTAYTYLPRSVANFPVEEDLADRMKSAGFTGVTWTSLSFGVAAIHVGERPVPGRHDSR